MRLGPVGSGLLFASALSAAAQPVTFSKDVLPVLEKRCQGCHRPGEAAPFSLLTYEESRPWAKAMKEAVLLRKMPPWFADPHIGQFSNDRSLSETEIATLVAWSDQGAPQGDPKDAPVPLQFLAGWRIPKPDVVIEMPNDFHVPASGVLDLQHIVVPSGFTEDRWIQCAEVRPGNPALVHHIVIFTREPGSKWLKAAKIGVPFDPDPKKHPRKKDDGVPGESIAGYAPGAFPIPLPPGQAILIKAGSDIVFQVHYTTNGKPGTDRSKLGIVFAPGPPKQRVATLAAYNDNLKIPAGDPNYRLDSVFDLGAEVQLTSLEPHMHNRGKDFEFRAIYPDGQTETLLRVLNYSFSWQLTYALAKPIVLPKGTRIQCTAHFDNSANNPNNPDPSKDVSWGDQTFDEMMIGFFSVAFDANVPLKSLTAEPAKEATKPRPKSPKEFAALRAFQDAQTPDQQLQAIENVLTNFTDTEFKVMLLQTAMQIEQRKGDFAQVLFYGERLLQADPKGAFALVTMASETARHTRQFDLDKDEKLAKVDQYAKAGLDAARVAPKPAGVSDDQWEAAKKDFQSQAYDAMGQAAVLRKKYDEAVADYKQAIAIAATPDAVTWIRLGQAYEDSAKLDEASDAFDKALATPHISPNAQAVAQSKKDEVAKRKGSGSKPAGSR
jgi:hypothetical protein